jgi:hypothetical protein
MRSQSSWATSCKVAPVAALAAAAAVWAGPSGASTPVKPLSSLGPLRPAPYPGRLGPELVPIPAAPPLAPPTSTARPTKTVDGIKCEVNETVLFHVHVHLTIFVGGKPHSVPAGIGIWPPLGPQNYRHGLFGITQGNCFSWLSTHYADGIIHIEAPIKQRFFLGQFFDLWGQPLSRSRVGPARGAVTAIVNRSVWTGDPCRIPLLKHSQIQLEVGKPLVAPQSITFPGGF